MKNFVIFLLAAGVEGVYKDIPCEWKSLTGAHFDLKPLIIPSGSTPYHILDGDIPCTPEVEAAYSYVWNFCTEIADEHVPQPCKDKGKSSAVAFQYMNYAEYSDCYVIGKYNPANDDLDYKLLDEKDPTKGVSITYALGEKCQSNSRMRSATIDVQCANVENVILSAQEPLKCEYHMVMQSYHGCPTECPITKNGLCNSHGHCAFDSSSKKSYCYCNSGYSGSSCTKSSGSSSSDDGEYDGLSVQVALLVTLVLIAGVLVAVISVMVYRITSMRKEQAVGYSLMTGEAEMAGMQTSSF